ncbi:MAG TPA: uracil phosphoribosyltransferase [Gemmataceae bacterium]|nr:uracil phosphoribosyltransferase [Gemmataceae bacterium]
MAQHVYVSDHPLVQHKLALLRDKTTEAKTFRLLVRELTQLLFYEATRDLKLAPLTVQSPLAECAGHEIAERIGLMPVLRAGLGMAEAILDMIPNAQVWHLGLYRDPLTLQPVTYYIKLPPQPAIQVALIVDPMLATGGSAIATIDILKKWGLHRIKFLGLIAAPEGVEALRTAHPDVPIHLAAVDSYLNDHKYIVPGLGDAGDRQFGTSH